jgi:hypothetical protein
MIRRRASVHRPLAKQGRGDLVAVAANPVDPGFCAAIAQATGCATIQAVVRLIKQAAAEARLDPTRFAHR